MSSQGWDELRKAAQSIGFDYNSVADGRMTGLIFSYSGTIGNVYRKKRLRFWAKLDSDVQGYLQNIIDCSDEIEDMKTKTSGNNEPEFLSILSMTVLFSTLSDMK
ncbi:hypothetical protein [Bacteroides sp. 14(A)]|uniref:hypothetical protein n=1 Tax=Bacteroides sp. 14(A) TaxID=1163670 RepID=UPI0004B5A063|nr:hypothetical protein [Bacteroides sp. 14(A)]